MRWFITVLWLSVAVAPFLADFNATHLWNPAWPPHARLHMMTMLTGAVAVAAFGLWLCWAPARDRADSLKLSALLGIFYSSSLVAACLAMPFYGGSLYWDDVDPRSPSLNDANLVIFAAVTLIFVVLFALLRRRSAATG